jgi:single-strand DNA-binding protein
MTVGETQVTVLGTVITDVTLKRVGENDHDLATFLVRAAERKYDREKAAWYDHRQFSIRVKCWRKLAAMTHAVLRRGDPVIVSGRLFVSDYETADGQHRSMPEIEAWAVGPNLMLCKATVDRARRYEPGETAGQGPWQAPAPPERTARAEEDEPMPIG